MGVDIGEGGRGWGLDKWGFVLVGSRKEKKLWERECLCCSSVRCLVQSCFECAHFQEEVLT